MGGCVAGMGSTWCLREFGVKAIQSMTYLQASDFSRSGQ